MFDAEQFNQRVAELEQMLRDKLGLRGKTLAGRLQKAGRRLPKRVHKAGRVITGAQAVVGNPKLARLQDQSAIDAAFTEMSAYLKPLNRRDQRKGFALGLAGDLAIRLILLAIALLAILRWQGMI
ncbi:hypothetical protein MNBD_ALPHA07-1976 [hydrothermal vent metagenome]|uniref:Uncharacterized protein n=1 Tax=hydrothermal vent metagenome TaxID=652676 RepID=A0A3B0SBV4_9ZZZZ